MGVQVFRKCCRDNGKRKLGCCAIRLMLADRPMTFPESSRPRIFPGDIFPTFGIAAAQMSHLLEYEVAIFYVSKELRAATARTSSSTYQVPYLQI
jgi:hypothetical protein